MPTISLLQKKKKTNKQTKKQKKEKENKETEKCHKKNPKGSQKQNRIFIEQQQREFVYIFINLKGGLFRPYRVVIVDMMNGGPSGFNNAPVTRAIVIACTLFTIIFGLNSPSKSQEIFQNLQIWKLIKSVFAFSSSAELVFGLYLLYYFRFFERQIGSNKYSVFVVFSFVVSLLLEVLALKLLKDPSWNVLASGPYGLIFSSFVPFYLDIPVSTRFHVFSLHFSDKAFIYLAGLQLLFASWRRSIVPGMCGIIAGCLYRLNIIRIRRLKFPEFIASFCSRLSWPSMGNMPAPAPTRNLTGNVPSFAGRQMEGNYPASFSSAIEPPEDSIATLVSMGFDRNSARQALMRARNDVNAATNILLESNSN